MDRSYMGLDVRNRCIGARKNGGIGACVGARKNGGNGARGIIIISVDCKTVGWEHAVCVVFPYTGYTDK